MVAAGAVTAVLAAPAMAGGRASSPEVTAARQKFFGQQNVDPRTGAVRDDQVIVSWITNASFAVAIKATWCCSTPSSPISRSRRGAPRS